MIYSLHYDYNWLIIESWLFIEITVTVVVNVVMYPSMYINRGMQTAFTSTTGGPQWLEAQFVESIKGPTVVFILI